MTITTPLLYAFSVENGYFVLLSNYWWLLKINKPAIQSM